MLKRVFDLSVERSPYIGIGEHFCNSFFKKLPSQHQERANHFLLNYCEENYHSPDKMNLLIDLVRHSMKDLFEKVLLLFLSLTQDKEAFSKIHWTGTGGVYINTIIGDICVAEWREVLNIVNKAPHTIRLLPIKNEIKSWIRIHLKQAERERRNNYLKD